ncbi:MAG: PIN domain-containing protein [Thermoleophilia bacterium]|nr:PIN domain-containing protein [Gaiellaceae bacterium]MDW8339444.1 PIN domain-containing protein [Thermoleophilia bacterium]
MQTDSPAILVDANLVLWAHHQSFLEHEPAFAWWAKTLSETPFVGIPWSTILTFVRVSTHPRALRHPVPIRDAWGEVRAWLARPNVRVPVPGDRHADLLGDLLLRTNATGNHTSDAHMAALAIEWGLELCSADRDFARYPGLRWRDPLSPD